MDYGSSPDILWSGGGGEAFQIDDLLDFSYEELAVPTAGAPTAGAGGSNEEKSRPESAFSERNSGDSSVTETEPAATATCEEVSRSASNVVESNSSVGLFQFPEELCVPADALEELNWMSTFEDDSLFAAPELVLQVDSVHEPAEREERQRKQSNALHPDADKTWVLRRRARSKRPRCVNPAFFFMSVAFKKDEHRAGRKAAAKGSVCSRTPAAVKKAKKSSQTRSSGGQESRRCSHCLVQKTPQWRTGPLGPKTLCNACGVRFKSGRLLPEYRPALSPTFSSGLHSNCHRRVVEIRRQKVDEQQPLPQQETSGLTDNSMADCS